MKYIFFLILVAFPTTCLSEDCTQIIFRVPYSSETVDNECANKKTSFQLQYENLKDANPEMDFENAVVDNDLRFIGTSGVGYGIPGVEKGEFDELVKKYGFKIIAWTSDVIYMGNPPLNSVAIEYAKIYNSNLYQYLDGLEKLRNK